MSWHFQIETGLIQSDIYSGPILEGIIAVW